MSTTFFLIYWSYSNAYKLIFVVTDGGTASEMTGLDSHEITSLSDNIDSTDDLVPSLQVCIL